MSENTGYAGWNPWHGCTKISAGCRYCYVYRQDETVSYTHLVLPLHHATDHFIQGAIAAAADDQIEPAGVLQHLPGAIESGAGGVDGDLVIAVSYTHLSTQHRMP